MKKPKLAKPKKKNNYTFIGCSSDTPIVIGMKESELDHLSDKYYSEYLSDKSAVGFDSLFKRDGFGSKIRSKIRTRIYQKYGKDVLVAMYRERLAKSSHKNRTSKSYVISPEQRQKMVLGIKKSWENAVVRKEQNRKLISEYCLPHAHSDIVNRRRVSSRQKGKGWNPHSDATRHKISITFKEKWKRGDYDNRASTIRSAGQKELHEVLLNLGYASIPEYRVNNKPFDCGIPSKKLLFEFNGTYWHLDPRKFDAHYWDEFRNVFAEEVWRKDMKKVLDAKRKGYRTITIWQQDWEATDDKQSYLLNKINERTE